MVAECWDRVWGAYVQRWQIITSLLVVSRGTDIALDFNTKQFPRSIHGVDSSYLCNPSRRLYHVNDANSTRLNFPKASLLSASRTGSWPSLFQDRCLSISGSHITAIATPSCFDACAARDKSNPGDTALTMIDGEGKVVPRESCKTHFTNPLNSLSSICKRECSSHVAFECNV